MKTRTSRRPIAGARRWLCLLGAVSALACRFEPASVTRLANGVEVSGRYVPPEAYAAYARGALLEAQGEPFAALAEYRRALEEDPDAPEILARIGALECRLSQKPGDAWSHAARQSFTRALSVAPDSSTSWLERARCEQRAGQVDQALGSAVRAAELDPRETPAALLVIELAEQSGRLELARTWLDALAVARPVPRSIWLRLLSFGARHGDLGRLLRAREGLRELGGKEPATPVLEESLRAGDLERARRAAIELRLAPGRLAVRAADAGALGVARAQSELVLAADPDDSDAWTAALLAASLERDTAAFAALLARAPVEPTPLGPEALRALDEVLSRAVGPEGRAALRTAASESAP